MLQDLGYHHPGLPSSELLYRFRNPVLPKVILQRRKDTGDLATRVLHEVEKILRPDTRAVANLYRGLLDAAHLESEAALYEKKLSYWTSIEDTEALAGAVARELRAGEVSPQLVWSMVENSADVWPPSRRLAVLKAYGA
jgi:hypothetical protein